MRITILPFLSLIYLLNSASAQTSSYPIYQEDSIRKAVQGYQSPFFYPILQKKFNTLNADANELDYYYLYHGKPFQEDYSPYGDPARELKEYVKKENYKKAYKLGMKILPEHPEDLDVCLYTFIACKKSGKDEEAELIANRFALFFRAILSTGEGSSQETAFRVNCVSDEYHVMEQLGLEVISQSLEVGNGGRSFDRIDVKPSEYYTEKFIYFDITRAFETLGKMLKGE